MNVPSPSVDSRVVRIEASEGSAQRRPGGFKLRALALTAIVGLCALSFKDSHAVTRNAFAQFPIGGALGLSEKERVMATEWPSFRIAQAIETLASQDEKTLVFRQCETAFYTRARFVYFFDAAVAPIFRSRTPEAAASALKAQGVRWMAIPDYRMPEIFNSPIAGIVASRDLSDLVVDARGFRLYRLRDERRSDAPVAIVNEAFSADNPGERRWRGVLLRKYGWSPAPESQWRFSTLEDGRLEGRAAATFLTDPKNVVQFQTDRLAPSYATLAMRSDLPTTHRMLDIAADLEGWGRMEVIVQSIAPATQNLVETVVWTGILRDERRIVQGRFDEDAASAGLAGFSERVHRVLVRLRGAGVIRFGGWRAEALTSPGDGGAGARKSATPADLGWSVPPKEKATAADIARRPVLTRGDDGAVVIGQRSDPSERVRGPWLAPGGPMADIGGEPFPLIVSATMSGTGAADVFAIYQCGEAEEQIGHVRLVTLSKDPIAIAERLEAPCLVSKARLEIAPLKNRFELPKSAALAEVRVHDQAISAQHINEASVVTLHEFRPARDIYFGELAERRSGPAAPRPEQTPAELR